MLTSDFAGPATAARHASAAVRAYGGSGSLPANINPRSLRGQPAAVAGAGKAQAGAATSDPIALRPLGVAAGVAGTIGAAEFMGPAAGWGIRKTLGRLPNWMGGRFFYNAGSIPAAPVNALYQAKFRDLFSPGGWRQMYANGLATADVYAHGGHVSMHGLDGVASHVKGFVGEVQGLLNGLTQTSTGWRAKLGIRPDALTDLEVAQRFNAMGQGKFGEVFSPELANRVKHLFGDHEAALEVYKNAQEQAARLGRPLSFKAPEIEIPKGLRNEVLTELGKVSTELGKEASHVAQQVRGVATGLAKDAHYFVNGENGVASAVKGTIAKPKYGWGFKPFSSWNPLHWARGDVLNQAQVDAKEIISGGKEWGFFGDQLKKLEAKGVAPKAFEATASEGLGLLERIGNMRAMSVLMKGGLVAAVGLLGIKLTQHFADQVGQAQEMHKDLTGKDVSAWRLLMRPSSLPPVAQHIRANLVEQTMPGAAHVLTEGLDKYAMSDGLRGFKFMPMVAGQVLGHTMSGFTPSTNFLSSYHAIKSLQKSGQPVPAEAYAALMAAASPDVRRSGGKAAPLVMKIAEDYATSNMSAADVVKEIEARVPFIERAKVAQAALLAEEKAREAAAAPEGPVAQEAKMDAAPQQEHVAEQSSPEKPTLKVATKAVPNAAMEHQGRVVEHQRQVV